nr:hypothetical protein CFP56_09598 [Quercus suber]
MLAVVVMPGVVSGMCLPRESQANRLTDQVVVILDCGRNVNGNCCRITFISSCSALALKFLRAGMYGLGPRWPDQTANVQTRATYWLYGPFKCATSSPHICVRRTGLVCKVRIPLPSDSHGEAAAGSVPGLLCLLSPTSACIGLSRVANPVARNLIPGTDIVSSTKQGSAHSSELNSAAFGDVSILPTLSAPDQLLCSEAAFTLHDSVALFNADAVAFVCQQGRRCREMLITTVPHLSRRISYDSKRLSESSTSQPLRCLNVRARWTVSRGLPMLVPPVQQCRNKRRGVKSTYETSDLCMSAPCKFSFVSPTSSPIISHSIVLKAEYTERG